MEKKTIVRYSDEWLIKRYFQYGSVEEAILGVDSTVPFSFADYHRRLTRYGIVGSAGRHTNLTEALHFFRMKQMEPGTPLERLYKRMPSDFKTSISTLHRIYDRIEQSIPHRKATAVIVSSENDPHQVLIAREIFSNPMYGKVAGINTIPMTFSSPRDTTNDRIFRVIQQEVLENHAINGCFSDRRFVDEMVSRLSYRFFTYYLLDVEVSCFQLRLPYGYSFSSHKLTDHKFMYVSDVLHDAFSTRVGVKEILEAYTESLFAKEVVLPRTSGLNLSLVSAL